MVTTHVLNISITELHVTSQNHKCEPPYFPNLTSVPFGYQINRQVPSAIVASRARGVRVQLRPKKPPARRPPRDSMNRTVDVVGNGENFWVDNDFNVFFFWGGEGFLVWESERSDVSWPLILVKIMI